MSRILIIDDEASVRESIAWMLKGSGHEALLAASGLEGARLCRAERPDLAIIDIFMPEQDGIETIIALRREFREIPIIAISGGHATSNFLLSAAQKMGAVSILEKPFSLKELLKATTEALATRTSSGGQGN